MKKFLNVVAVSILGIASFLNSDAKAAGLKQVQTRLTVFNVPQALYVKLSEDPNLQNPGELRTALMSAVESGQATIQVIHEAVGKSGQTVIAGSFDELTYASAIQNGLPVLKTTKVGTYLELESTVGPDGYTIDYQFSYSMIIKLPTSTNLYDANGRVYERPDFNQTIVNLGFVIWDDQVMKLFAQRDPTGTGILVGLLRSRLIDPSGDGRN